MASKKKYKTDSLGNSKGSSRFVVNLCSFLVTLCAIGLVTSAADGSFSRNFNEISRRLDKKLEQILEDIQIDYKEIDINGTYNSTTTFNPKGMGGLYNLTKIFMDWTVPIDFIPKGVINIVNGKIEIISVPELQEKVPTYAAQFAGLISILAAFALMLICFPLCGLCFCFCRCCGNCGARSRPFDKKNDLCRKVLLATLLIIAGTALLFGVVCAFVSNQQIQEGTEELPSNLRVSVKDSNTFLDTTNLQLRVLLIENYNQFHETVFNVLDNTSAIVFEGLEDFSNATTMDKITGVAENLNNVSSDFTKLIRITRELRVDASQLNDALRKVKYDLIQTLNQCQASECGELLSKHVSKLDTDIDFNAIPDITEETKQLEEVLKNFKLVEYIQEGEKQLQEIKDNINQTVSYQLVEVKESIDVAGVEVRRSLANITSVIEETRNSILGSANRQIDKADRYIKEYSPYRYYVGIAMSSVLLLVVICIALGLVCGICGKRPDSYSDDCCNKGAGSRFLMCGVGIMFLFSVVLLVLTLVYFILGIVSQRVVCDPLRDPKNSQLVDLVDKLVDFQEVIGIDVNVSSAIEDCHAGKSIYKVLHLESKFNLSKVKNFWHDYKIDEKLAELQNKLSDNQNFDKLDLLKDDAVIAIDKLKQAKLSSIDFDKFIDEVSGNLTTEDLSDIKNKIDEIIALADRNRGIQNIVPSLKTSSLHIETYQEKIVNPMKRKMLDVRDTAKALNKSLSFGGMKFEDGLEQLKISVKQAEEVLKKNGTELLKRVAAKHIESLEKVVKHFLDRVTINIEKNVGKCGPLSTVFNGVLTSTCDKIVQPVNGFWFGIFWSLVLFIPTIILSVKLATLYQKYDPYPGSVVEAEYLYDAYADRENIPLSGMPGKHSKKRKNKKGKRYERGAYMPEAGDQGRDFAGGSHHQDARYADMAPKHWEDFPANGPPQYQRAPTEYDRPPPYYYPGTNDSANH